MASLIAALLAALFFALWQGSILAGLFALAFLFAIARE